MRKLFSSKKVNKRLAAFAMVAALSAATLSGCDISSVLSGSSIGSGGTVSNNTVTNTGEFDVNSQETDRKTNEIEQYIDNYFYFEQDSANREESYYDGIMKGLDDPYSVYYTPDEYQKLLEDDGGSFVGIGATVSKNVDTNEVYVVKPIPGSPAEAAGLLPGDIICEVNGVTVEPDMELQEVVDMIRGEEGTVARIKIYRKGEPDYLWIDITRAVVETVTVSSEMLADNIGYIKVEQFIENTPEQFETQMDELINKGAKGIVIDMRDNPGGLLNSVVEMCDYIVDDGVIVSTKDKDGNMLQVWRADDDHSVNIPMTVLVNGNSASASEIFTGCMKDYGLATIVGTTTFGKGIVQSIFPLNDGSAIKITIAKYFTPSGNDIHKIGIEPDVVVELSDEQMKMVEIPHDEDPQLQKAIEILNK